MLAANGQCRPARELDLIADGVEFNLVSAAADRFILDGNFGVAAGDSNAGRCICILLIRHQCQAAGDAGVCRGDAKTCGEKAKKAAADTELNAMV